MRAMLNCPVSSTISLRNLQALQTQVTWGESRLARRLTTILPAMSLAEALETTRIPRAAGRTGARTAWVTACP
jgi:predicted ATPase with chaperone activity